MGSFSKLLSSAKAVILDSAMGTELQKRGADVTLPLWSARAIVDNPDLIRQIHIENIDAGADVITTNTFRTQRRTLEKAGFRLEGLDFRQTAKELTSIAVDLSRDAVMITRDDVIIAGCIAPLEDCYRPELVPGMDTLCSEQYEHVQNLIDAGVDLLLAETMGTVREISAVLNQVHKTGVDYCISMLCRNEKELYSGEKLMDAVSIIEKYDPPALLVNCIHPSLVAKLVPEIRKLTGRPLGAYANVGIPGSREGEITEPGVSDSVYLKYAKEWRDLGVSIIGGCCGTGPEYIKLISVLKN